MLQIENAARQFRFARMKLGLCIGPRGVNDSARRQHKLHRLESVIGVLLDAAAHTAGVIGENTAHGAGRDRGRIGSDFRAIGHQRQVGTRADHSRLHPNLLAPIFNLDRSPVARDVHQQAVGDRLSRQARTGGAKRHRYALPLAECKQRSYLFQPLSLHHCLRDQTIETGIGSVRDEVDWTDKDATAVDGVGKSSLDFLRRNLHRSHVGHRHFCSSE